MPFKNVFGFCCCCEFAVGFGFFFLIYDFVCLCGGVVKDGLNPYAVEVMAEDGIDISQQKSKLIDLDYFNAADLIVTLCGDAKDRCPIIPPQAQSLHWPLPDPAQAKGTHEQKMIVFRQVRDEIKKLVQELN